MLTSTTLNHRAVDDLRAHGHPGSGFENGLGEFLPLQGELFARLAARQRMPGLVSVIIFNATIALGEERGRGGLKIELMKEPWRFCSSKPGSFPLAEQAGNTQPPQC